MKTGAVGKFFQRFSHRLGDDLSRVPGAETPELTDTVARRLSVCVTDIGQTGSWLVPLENLQVSTGFFEYVEGDRRPVLRFCGWSPFVTAAGLQIGSTGIERPLLLQEKVRAERQRNAHMIKAVESRLAQIERLHAGLSSTERAVFDCLPLDLNNPPAALQGAKLEETLQALKVRGLARTDDHVVWEATSGCIWYKNALIGRRYCTSCVLELGRKTKEIETGRPHQTCPRCGTKNQYVGQSLPRTFNYYAQEESLSTAHVTRAHRSSPVAALSDAHKTALLTDQEVLDLRLPRDVYAERAVLDGNPIDPNGVREIIVKWAQGWVPFASRSPVTGMVGTIGTVEGQVGLFIEVGGRDSEVRPDLDPRGSYWRLGECWR